MKLADYFQQQERGAAARLAAAIGAHAPDVSNWAKGTRPVPTHYGAAIEKATGGQVTRKELFPDSWQRIWPELARSKRTKPQAAQSAQAGQGA